MKTSLIALSACMIASPALADEAEQGRDYRTSIIVTGQRDPLLQTEVSGRLGLSDAETPAIVDVLTQADMQNLGLRSAIEAMNAAPGVASGNLPGSMGSVSMRGFHRAVNYLYDGVRMPNSDAGMRNWDAWSFERIEVIKGPASVTSGEGALAGAINFVPRRAKLGVTGGEVMASYGSFDSMRLAGAIDLPISPKVAVHANSAWSRSDGWVDDTDSRTFAASGSILLQPSERFSLSLSADYFEDRFSTAYFGTPIVSRDAARNPSSVVSGSAGLVLDKAMRRVNFDVLDSDVSSDSLWLRARAEWQMSDQITLVSDTAYNDSFRNWQNSDEYTFNAGTQLIDRYTSWITHAHQFITQRVHLAYDGAIAGMRARVTAGVEAGHSDFFTKRRFGTATSADLLQPERGYFPEDTPQNFGTRQDITAEVDQLAFFGEAALDVTDQWLVVGGIRYDDIALDREILNATTGALQNYGQDYDPISWRIGSVFSLTPKTQIFAQYTKAVTPVSGLLFMSAGNAAFDLSKGQSYEVGVKSRFADDKVQLTASVFHIRQDDILTRDPNNVNVTVQGGSQTSKGAEMSVQWAATDEWSAGLSGTWLKAEFDTLVEAGGVDRSGNRPANVPEHLVDFTLSYAPKSLPIRVSSQVRHNGNFYTSNANNVKVRGFTTWDAAIAWDSSIGTVTLRGRNLTNEFYADWSGYASGLVFVGAPRSFDISLSTRF